MTKIQDASNRQPKGDHNRRLALGLDVDRFAAEAGITVEALGEYERTGPDHRFDSRVAQRVGEALERLEAILPNSQTGRLKPAVNVHFEDIGTFPKVPLLNLAEDTLDHPLYGPGDNCCLPS
jgi:hypothetical protein